MDIPVLGIGAGSYSESLARIWRQHPESRCVVAEPDRGDPAVFDGLPPPELGRDALADLARMPDCLVLNGVVGFAGLEASLTALEAGNRLGLANKESFVTGGDLMRELMDRGGEVIPVDSEHSAIFQCLLGESPDMVESLILTASGGPFRGATPDQLALVTPEQALRHPTWEMGERITIDSATLMNKGMEVIEAHHLFGMPFERIEVIVHPQSIAHSMVRFVDGSIKAHLGETTMSHPVRYAFTHPERAVADVFPLAGLTLEFEEVDRAAFPALDLAYEVGGLGGTAPTVLNAADEVLVDAFLKGKVGFLDIIDGVSQTVDRCGSHPVGSVSDLVDADTEARRVADGIVLRLPSR